MMYGTGAAAATSFAWVWFLLVAACLGLIAGVTLLFLGRSPRTDASATPGQGPGRSPAIRFGGGLALISLVAILALGGLTAAGMWPHPGQASVGPGSPNFVPGTAAAPRVVRIVAGPGLRFYPDVVPVGSGETVTFEVTTMGLSTHEFMVGPVADVNADTEGTPEVADIGMMQTKSVTYTFTGSGPFAFACHATGHFEAGMKGTISIAP